MAQRGTCGGAAVTRERKEDVRVGDESIGLEERNLLLYLF